MRIVIGGQANCGKSTLVASIHEYLRYLHISSSIHEIDVYSDTIPCILSQKPWSERKKKEKGSWQKEAISLALGEFHRDNGLIVLGDLPGFIDYTLEKMIEPADFAIVLGTGEDDIQEWANFFKLHGIPVILKVISQIDGDTNNVHPDNSIIVRNLNRKVLFNPEILSVVLKIISLTKT